MEPKNNNRRQKYPGSDYVNTYRFDDEPEEPQFFDLGPMSVSGAEAFEGFDLTPNNNIDGDIEKRRMEALKRAIEIAKLMDNVNVQNILDIAETVDKYLTI